MPFIIVAYAAVLALAIWQDEHGTTALILAAWYGHQDLVRLLLKLKADPNLCDEQGITPLMAASYTGHPEIVKVFFHLFITSAKEVMFSPLFVCLSTV